MVIATSCKCFFQQNSLAQSKDAMGYQPNLKSSPQSYDSQSRQTIIASNILNDPFRLFYNNSRMRKFLPILLQPLILRVTTFLNTLTASKSIIPSVDGKRTKPYMPKAKILYQISLLSSCNLLLNMASNTFQNQPWLFAQQHVILLVDSLSG